jgi:hypothetical protein
MSLISTAMRILARHTVSHPSTVSDIIARLPAPPPLPTGEDSDDDEPPGGWADSEKSDMLALIDAATLRLDGTHHDHDPASSPSSPSTLVSAATAAITRRHRRLARSQAALEALLAAAAAEASDWSRRAEEARQESARLETLAKGSRRQEEQLGLLADEARLELNRYVTHYA